MFVQIIVQILLICAGQCALGHVMVEDVENILIQIAHVGQRGVIVDASRLEIVMALVGVVVVDPDRLVHVVEAVRELVLPVLLALLLVLEVVLVVLDHHSVLLDVTHLVRTPLVDLLVLLTVPVILVRLLAEAHVLMLVV